MTNFTWTATSANVDKANDDLLKTLRLIEMIRAPKPSGEFTIGTMVDRPFPVFDISGEYE